MSGARSVIFNVIGHDNASKAFLSASKSAEVAATGVDRSIRRMEASGARMQAVGQRMSKAITLPVIAAAAVSVKQAVDFQKSMTLLETAGGETEKKMAVISKGIKNVATSTGTSLHDLADGMYTVAKAGALKWSAIDQLKILKAAAQGAKAENVDLATATNALTSVMASYGMKASDAVSAENMLIRGSGLAKTTFQDFAGSLSSVVPLASSLHISFAEVAGAIATMTQHGESAQRSTDNLSNLITALAGQNNVASGAMQQLGIDTVALQKNLGKNGLSGTLDIVENAIRKSSKGGMVVVSAFKQAQIATKSLGTEIAAMPPQLGKLSSALLTGKIHRSEYLKSIKSMSLENYTLGRNFLLTTSQALGFNSILKSGKGDQLTAATALQKMLGGVTGMRAALMLGGPSAKQFASNVREVAKAAGESGADVLGWAKTQDTLAVKLDKAKANLQVLAVEIGTALIPAVSKVVGWVSSAVKWFDGLSGSSKKLVGGIILVGATLGPVLAILGRLTKGFAILWGVGVGAYRLIAGIRAVELSIGAMESRAYLAGLRMRTAFSGGISAARGLGSAMAGLAAGTALGSLTRGASGAEQALGALGSTAIGAASGFAIGGPWGAAIGGGVGLLSNLATNFLGAGGAAKDAIKPTDEYTQAILRDNDALGANTRSITINSLQKRGLYDAGLKLGISQKTLTDAMMGSTSALAAVAAAQRTATLGSITRFGATSKEAQKSHELDVANRALTQGIGDVTKTLAVNKRAADNITAANGKAAGSANHLSGSLDKASRTRTPKLNISPMTAQATAIQARINAIRQNRVPSLKADTSQAQFALSLLQSKLDSLQSRHLSVSIDTYNRTHAVKVAAAGGFISGPGSGTSDSIPARLSNGEFVINAKSTARHLGLLHAINSGAKGFASGGLVGSALSGVVTNIAGLLAAGHNRLSTAADLRDAAKSLRDAARSAKVSAGEYASMLRQSGALARLGSARDVVAARLGTGPTASTAYDRLATQKGYYHDAYTSVRGSVYGSFDVTQAGVNAQVYSDRPAAPVSAGSILAQLKTAAGNASRFAGLLRRLSRNGLPKSLLLQLAQAGPAAMAQAQALSVATPAQILGIRSAYSQLGSSATYSGKLVAGDLYGAGVASAQGLVNGLLSKQSALNAAIRKLADGMTKQLKRSLGIHSPSRVMRWHGEMAGEGFRLGVASKHDAIAAEGNRMAHKVQPSTAPTGSVNGSGERHYHFYGMDVPAALAAAERRERMMAAAS